MPGEAGQGEQTSTSRARGPASTAPVSHLLKEAKRLLEARPRPFVVAVDLFVGVAEADQRPAQLSAVPQRAMESDALLKEGDHGRGGVPVAEEQVRKGK